MRHEGIDVWDGKIMLSTEKCCLPTDSRIILLKVPSLEPSQKQPIKTINSLINKLKVSQKEKNKGTLLLSKWKKDNNINGGNLCRRRQIVIRKKETQHQSFGKIRGESLDQT